MRRYLLSVLLLIAGFILYTGCTSQFNNPVLTRNTPDITERHHTSTETHLWGLYDVFIDTGDGVVDCIASRNGTFTANVVNFLNTNPQGLQFDIIEIIPTTDGIDIDINIGITHPFPGLPQYNGYDVRGIFMGDGSRTLSYNSGDYFDPATDQHMLPDPDDSIGGPDGYTRWFNEPEFSEGGMPLFQYTPGKVSTQNYSPDATVCPYKYFANSLGTDADLWDYLLGNPDLDGIFTSGATNERNYYLRFPSGTGTRFAYAVIASWEGTDDDYHPANAPEAVACSIEDHSNIYFSSPSDNGGNLDLDISLWIWNESPSNLIIESTVLSNLHEFDPDTIVTGGWDNYSTWHVDIPADDITGTDDNEYWIIAEYDGFDYQNDYGSGNLTGDDPLAAFFRYNLDVSPEPVNLDPLCDLQVVTEMPVEEWTGVEVEFDASGSYDPDGGVLTYEWDFDGDEIYGEDPDDSFTGTDENPTHTYSESYYDVVNLRLTDDNGGETICSTDALDVTVNGCPDTDMPSGTPGSHHVTYSNNCRSGIARAYGDSGEEYLIGHTRDYYGRRYGFYALDENGSVIHSYITPVQPDYPPTLQGMACTTSNRLYVITYSQYIYHDYTLYHMDFDPDTGFSGLLQTSSMPSISPWYFVKICIDENDYPVALVGNGTDLAIKHWNGSAWDHIDIADDATMYAECGYWNNGIEDIAYHPISETYWITNRYHGYTPNYDGVPTLYVIDKDGETSWKDDELYPDVPSATQYSAGVDIDVQNPDCRTLVLVCCGSTGVNEFEALFIRYDPFGNQTGTGYMDNTSDRYEFANGSVIAGDTDTIYGGPLDLAGVSTGITSVPDW